MRGHIVAYAKAAPSPEKDRFRELMRREEVMRYVGTGVLFGSAQSRIAVV